ncbi:helix-turn-helix domain-containing protein [Protaetiibacter larvae]|uniref:HTH-type transcriptional regulator RipA n=1 Tax=Protaetiibacter larvae TaxID=2592654 RepID=A0A5C1Y9I2_9MICO|nr:AraC family transcriptional regulator [Protaetiibacter larvae]QEO10584.1 AraC family transcriptional regulator [Protaetiibacter larvae]
MTAHAPRLRDSVAHVHPVDELTWVASGHSTVLIDEVPWQLDTRTALLIPSGVEHVVVPRPDSLVFPVLVPELATATGVERPVLIRRGGALDDLVAVVLQPGLAEEGAVPAAHQRIRELLPCLVDDRPTLPVDDRARQVARAILASPGDERSLEEWATSCHTSSKTLQRSFRRETGLTFPQWRQAARLSAARRMLDAGAPVAHVARAVGYAGATPFIEAFRRRYGTTPARARAASSATGRRP